MTPLNFTQSLSEIGFATQNSINRNLQVTPSASPKEAKLPSVNSDIIFNRFAKNEMGL